ncbi:alpha/beta hydrolase [Streptomyces sp. NPDC051561]|uniref:alpha/beta hydrolase n=1 Tax=Streptomyces sp. NPDC051561 TaxID=3365658 RepID=UPI003797CB7E
MKRPTKRPTKRLFSRLIAATLVGSALTLSLSGCSDEGSQIDFNSGFDGEGSPQSGVNRASVANDGVSRLPMGPRADFRITGTLEDGTKVAETTLTGAKSGVTGKVWVWAPKEYFDPKYERSGFPVLIALPGAYGFNSNYWAKPTIPFLDTVARMADEGTSLPFVVVMPILNPAKRYYDGSDIPGQPKMGTWVTDDVPDFVRANFRTFNSRDGWAFMGSSSGGFVALKSVLKRPDRFKAVISSGPDIVPDSPLWKNHPKEKLANNPRKLAGDLIKRPGGPDIYLAFQVGSTETLIPRVNRFIKDFGKGPVKTHLEVVPDGVHSPGTYVRGMEAGSLGWISQHLKAPVPSE